jgi:hypothetical protein
MFVLLLAAMLQSGGLSMKTLDQGTQSGHDEARQVVVRSTSEWTTLWQVHAPDRKPPAVDFAQEMVVGVFVGTRPTAGFGVEIQNVREEKGALIVQYRETRPAANAMTAQVLTMPYHLVAIPRRAGDVKFEKAK